VASDNGDRLVYLLGFGVGEDTSRSSEESQHSGYAHDVWCGGSRDARRCVETRQSSRSVEVVKRRAFVKRGRRQRAVLQQASGQCGNDSRYDRWDDGLAEAINGRASLAQLEGACVGFMISSSRPAGAGLSGTKTYGSKADRD
jgi:hypothetical protein